MLGIVNVGGCGYISRALTVRYVVRKVPFSALVSAVLCGLCAVYGTMGTNRVPLGPELLTVLGKKLFIAGKSVSGEVSKSSLCPLRVSWVHECKDRAGCLRVRIASARVTYTDQCERAQGTL